MPGVDPQIKQYGLVIGWFQVLVSAFVVPVENAGYELVEPEEQVTQHRRLLARR